MLKPTTTQIPDFPAEIGQTNQVKVERIEDVFRLCELARPPYLLKIDVQGFELEVLQGAVGLLPDVAVVLCEVNAEDFYAGQAGFEQIYLFMREHGFKLVDLGEPIRARATEEVLYFDVAFLKGSPRAT